MQNSESTRDGSPASSLEASKRDPMTSALIAAAIDVHRELGPGLLESTYEACLCWELARANIPHLRQHELPVIYKGERIDCGYRLDILVQNRVVLELNDGRKLDSGDIRFARGNAKLPLDGAELKTKFLDCTAGAAGLDAAALYARLDAIEQLASVRDLLVHPR